MFRRVAMEKVRNMEAFLGEGDSDARARDCASSGPCDKSAYIPPQSGTREKVAYTLICPRDSLEVCYELPS